MGGCASRNLLLVYLTMQAGLGSGETMIARNMHKLRGTNVHAYTYKGQRRDPAAVKVARGQPVGDHSSRIVETEKTGVYRNTMIFPGRR